MAFVQGDKGSTTGATTVANAGITTTTGNCMVVCVAIGSAQTISSITDTFGNTWVPATSNFQTVSGSRIYVYWALNITGGASHQVTANLSASTGAAISVAEFSGRATSSLIAAQVANLEGARSASHTSAASGTLPTGCDVVCLAADSAFIDQGTNEVYTPGGSWVLPAAADVNTSGTTNTAYLLYQNNVGTGSQTATWTNSAGTITAASVILALAATAASQVPYMPYAFQPMVAQ